MEGERQPPGAASAAVSKVLDDDNLLIGILLRIGFPTTLVLAALVCKRWLWRVSQPAFLRRFRKLHHPHLLGFYINTGIGLPRPSFTPILPQPPELAAVIKRACFCLDTWHAPTDVMNCRNGRVFTRHPDRHGYTLGVYRPLFPERGMATVPPFPSYQLRDGSSSVWHDLLSKEQGDDLSYFYLSIESTKGSTKFTAQVCMLHDGVWCTRNTLAGDLPFLPLRQPRPVLVDDKIYIAAEQRKLIVLDLTVSSFSTIHLPQGVEYGDRDTMLSPADDASGVNLIQAKEFQLRIWLHKCNSWILVHSICLHEMCADLRMSDCTVEDEHISFLRIKQVGDNAEFVFFQTGQCVLYLDIKCRTLRKVYTKSKNDNFSAALSICPFKMIWPPIFPALKDDPSRNSM